MSLPMKPEHQEGQSSLSPPVVTDNPKFTPAPCLQTPPWPRAGLGSVLCPTSLPRLREGSVGPVTHPCPGRGGETGLGFWTSLKSQAKQASVCILVKSWW